jgi:membrane carboxypeptidase/penicillin-binding protein PbpC
MDSYWAQSIATDGQWRFPYNDSVPDKFKKCIIAFEDKRFEHHPGFDPLAFGRAIKQNIIIKKSNQRWQYHHHAGHQTGNQA